MDDEQGEIWDKEDDIVGTAEESRSLHMPRTVNGTGHTGPSEFCATSI